MISYIIKQEKYLQSIWLFHYVMILYCE
jgi:hypothetical protein